MSVSVFPTPATPSEFTSEALGITLFEEDLSRLAELGSPLAPLLTEAAELHRFSGKKEQAFSLPLPSSLGISAVRRVYVAGMGPSAKATCDAWRFAAAGIAKSAARDKVTDLLLWSPGALEPPCGIPKGTATKALVEGTLLGNDRGTSFRTKKEDDDNGEASLARLSVAGGTEEDLTAGLLFAEAQLYARHLANEPGNMVNPSVLAERAQALALAEGLECTVHDDAAIREMGMEGLWSVGKGSKTPPRLIHLVYRPGGTPRKKVVLVGKGLTFDSGGLNIKTEGHMRTMKGDKSGACVVLGAMQAVARLHPDLEVHALVGAAENMPDGGSYRPDDVLRAKNGKTIEIDNTDAEGRVTLADVLCFASEIAPSMIIDVATLTGSCVVALGEYTAGLFSTSDELAEHIYTKGKEAGERFWRLPLDDERLRKKISSPIADVVNSGGRYGGAITAAMFLQEFVAEGIDWAHLDIAGVDNYKEPYGYYGKGATGFGVRTLLEVLRSL
jgi:leucyl aminopeptidase